MYDTVHIFKSIRNNWINQNNTYRTFHIPFWVGLENPSESDVQDEPVNSVEVKFSDLQDLYKKESNMLVKSAPHLNHKTYPSSFDRQKVNLVINVFNETTVSALKKHGYQSTAYFINVILTWWSMVNIKRPMTHVLKINYLVEPFRDLDDIRLCFLENFILWLSKWKESREGNVCVGFLTSDSFNALLHSTKVLI